MRCRAGRPPVSVSDSWKLNQFKKKKKKTFNVKNSLFISTNPPTVTTWCICTRQVLSKTNCDPRLLHFVGQWACIVMGRLANTKSCWREKLKLIYDSVAEKKVQPKLYFPCLPCKMILTKYILNSQHTIQAHIRIRMWNKEMSFSSTFNRI